MNATAKIRVCPGCNDVFQGLTTYCSVRCRERTKKRRARARARAAAAGTQPPSPLPETSVSALAQLAVQYANGQSQGRDDRRSERELARTQAAAAEQAHTIALQAEQIDALRQELDAARAIAQRVHEDARWLATQVALAYRVKGWTGYTGEVRAVVERYVRTGH